ncbi:MAG: hypothetical protein JXN65_00030 [Clostridia bacterium]|nr:hypothetical protein [Clostridia bacterium]
MKIRKYLTIFNISLRNAVYYNKNLFGGVIMYTLFIYVFFRLWGVIYSSNTIANYTYSQMIWYVCITEMTSLTIGTTTLYKISQDIKNGDIAYQLGRPYNYLMYVFSNTMGASFVKFCLYILTGGILGTVLVGIPNIESAVMVPYFVLSFVLSIIMQFSMLMTIALSAFFVEESRPFFFIYSKFILMLGTFVPIEFFPSWLQKPLKYLPFSLVTWGPAKIFVAFNISQATNTIMMQTTWAVVLAAICYFVFKKGVRNVHVHGG